MGKAVKDTRINTAQARRSLRPRGKPYYRLISEGLHLGYRKPTGGKAGKWVVRRYVGDQAYAVETIATADDEASADGDMVLSFAQAQAKALKTDEAGPARKGGRLTVQQAVDSYIDYLRAHKKTADGSAGRLAKHILPRIGTRPVVELTKAEVERCQRAMVHRNPDDPEVERRSKDSSNRVLTMLKAALTRAFEDEDNGIPTDAAWRRVKPFRNVSRAREVHLDAAQANRLINSTDGAFRRLVTAALLTGARPPHELVTLRVRDFRADLGTLSVRDGKTGPRDVVLTKEGIRFFQDISAGRAPDALLLPRDNGSPWNKSDHARPMIEAVAKAKLPKNTTVYSLRHTHASQGLLAGMNIQLLAENMGTSVRMIEQHYGKFIKETRRKMIEESGFKLGLQPGKVTSIDRSPR